MPYRLTGRSGLSPRPRRVRIPAERPCLASLILDRHYLPSRHSTPPSIAAEARACNVSIRRLGHVPNAISSGQSPSEPAIGTGLDRSVAPSLVPEGCAAMAGASPTVRQRELGVRLRQLRHDLGLTVEDVARELLCSATKISRIETGARRPSLRDVRDLCQIYRVADPAAAAELMDLARQAREPGWWTQYNDLGINPYIGLEQEATAITAFTMYWVPALVQTEDYARAMIRGIAPKISPAISDQRVEARMRRQQLLDQENPPRLRMLLDEAVLHRQVGGVAVMQAQLDKILKIAASEKGTVQVIPFDAGAHASADSNFVFLEFGDSELPGLVFVEGLVSMLYQERPTELARYREALEYLRDAALSPRDSINRITELRNSMDAD
jgi:transcriptional regulator with XRE-family HTH domain